MMTNKKWIEFKTLPEYFDFFEAIPEEKWFEGSYIKQTDNSCKCALGHLGVRECDELSSKHSFRSKLNMSVPSVNDGNWSYINIPYSDLGDHPKERILNAIILAESGIMEDV